MATTEDQHARQDTETEAPRDGGAGLSAPMASRCGEECESCARRGACAALTVARFWPRD